LESGFFIFYSIIVDYFRKCNILYNMKTATVRQLRHDFGEVLSWIMDGEEVIITKHRRSIARMLPVVSEEENQVKMPDFSKRMEKVFGSKILKSKDIQGVIDYDRGDF
jgi:antitoxin (DNA-binding transcriptional repressor) of toxin-antitoxin stability system